jgi:hypothetical protein
MSWFFGYCAKHTFNPEQISKFHPKAISCYKNANYYLAVGGNPNLIFTNGDNYDFKFVVCGLGIFENAEGFLNGEDWTQILNDYPNGIDNLNGHFCGVLIKDNSIHLFTDILGLREVHILESKEGWYFSTRLDWLLKIQNCEINFHEFSSRWLLMNQISHNSIIKNIDRLICGAQAVIKNDEIKIKKNNWLPKTSGKFTVEDYKEKLKSFVLLGKENNLRISLNLSGGLDSRVILSFLLNSDYEKWNCNTFITDAAADTEIAKKIASDFNISFTQYENDSVNKNVEEIINELFEYIGATYITESAFSAQILSNYANMPQDELIIDGGFGEIWRREFLLRLFYYGGKDIEGKNFQKVSQYLENSRANIFSDDINKIMNEGIINQLEDINEKLPNVKEIGLENWLDIFSVKTRLVNYYSAEQARLDSIISSYMPFAQLDLLNELLNLSVNERKDFKLFKEILFSNSKKLSKYKLAKGNISYPFYFSSIMKRIYFKINAKIKKDEGQKFLDKFLEVLREFVMDSLLSGSAKTYAPYDYQRVYNNVTSYYKGNTSLKNFVNWFITFEIFRQIVDNNK